MENFSTKIPRLREPRYTKNQATFFEIKPRIHGENQNSQMKRTVSFSQIDQYEPLAPEQFTIKYKNYPHKFCKKSCIICGMGKPQSRTKSIKIELPKVDSTSTFTQTVPPSPPPERWNAQTQTNKLEIKKIDSTEGQTQTEHKRVARRSSFSLLSYGVWFSLFIVIFAIAVMFTIKHIDVLKWVTRKQLRQPKTLLEKVLSYFHRDKILVETSDRSQGHVPQSTLFVLCFSLVLIFGINGLF